MARRGRSIADNSLCSGSVEIEGPVKRERYASDKTAQERSNAGSVMSESRCLGLKHSERKPERSSYARGRGVAAMDADVDVSRQRVDCWRRLGSWLRLTCFVDAIGGSGMPLRPRVRRPTAKASCHKSVHMLQGLSQNAADHPAKWPY